MFKRQLSRFALVAALVTTLSAMAPAIGQAAGPGGTGPNDAMAPSGTSEHLNVGQSRWYTFTSAGQDKDGNPSHVLITMGAQPDGSAAFDVWTAERLNERANSSNPDKDAPPVGVGTKIELTKNENDKNPRSLYNGALVWAEDANAPQTYFVNVRQTGPMASDYQLSITGDAVGFPTATAAGMVAAMSPAVKAAAAGAPKGGTGPGDALAPSTSYQHLDVGQSRWYAFASAGKDKNGDPSHVLITLFAQPDGSASFKVWTAERLKERAASSKPDQDAPPIGAGAKIELTKNANDTTPRELFNGAQVWAGAFNSAQTYLVEVYQIGSQPSDYLLTITGDAVSFPTSTIAALPAKPTTPHAQAVAAGTPKGGTGPGDALAPSASYQHLNVGQSRWYAFTSAGKDKNGDPSHVLITLFDQPDGSASFRVWTAERLKERAASSKPDQDAPPIGAGAKIELTKNANDTTPRELFNGAQVWAGAFDSAQTYLVEVYQIGSLPSDYLLTITGDAVSFP